VLLAQLETNRNEFSNLHTKLPGLDKEFEEKQKEHREWVNKANMHIATSITLSLPRIYKSEEKKRISILETMRRNCQDCLARLHVLIEEEKSIVKKINELPETFQQRENQLRDAFGNQQTQLQKRYAKWLENINKMMPEML